MVKKKRNINKRARETRQFLACGLPILVPQILDGAPSFIRNDPGEESLFRPEYLWKGGGRKEGRKQASKELFKTQCIKSCIKLSELKNYGLEKESGHTH